MKTSDINTEERDRQMVNSIDLRQLINKYLSRWYVFAISIFICIGCAFFYLKTTTPQYSITSAILIRSDEQGSNKSQSGLYGEFENLNRATKVENEIEILRSKRLMERALSELQLQATYYIDEGSIYNREIYGKELPIRLIISELDSSYFRMDYDVLRIHIVDNSGFQLEINSESAVYHRFGEEVILPYAKVTIVKNGRFNALVQNQPITIEILINDLAMMAEDYMEQFEVEIINKQASAVSLELVESLPEKGVNIINKLVHLYNTEAIDDKNQAALNTIQFIDERLTYLTSELSSVERSVQRYKDYHDITDVNSEAQFYLQSSTDYQKQLSQIEIQIAVVESMQDYLKNENDRYSTVPSSLNVDNPTFSTLVNRYNEMQLERERMLQSYLPSNPLVQNVNSQLDNLRKDILQNLVSIKQSLEIALRNLQSSSSQIQSRVQRVPRIERELLEISRQQGIKQEHYLYLLKKREEAAIMLSAANVNNARVIDPARASIWPVEPNKKLVAFAALLIGLLIPYGFIEIKDLLNNKVLQKQDIIKRTNVPVLGEIAKYKKDGLLAISERKSTPIAEQFRMLRSNLHFTSTKKHHQVIMVTSTMTGEGKSFLSLNLGMSLSMIGKKVALIEFDLRKPKLLNKLTPKPIIGISEYILDENIQVSSIVHRFNESANLFVAGAGKRAEDPAEIMLSPRVGTLIEELKKNFDHVIIDTSPIGQVADAFSLASYSDLILYVVRQNYTLKSQLEDINEIDNSEKLKNMYIILNGISLSGNNRYVYGTGYS